MSKQTLSQAIIYLTAFTLLGKLLSISQQILIGRVFGSSADTDAFFIAQIVPFLVGGIFATALTTALIPILADRHNLQPGALSGLSLMIFGMLLILSLWTMSSSETIIRVLGHGFTGSTMTIAQRLLRSMSVLIALMGMSGVLTAFFYARSRFLLPAIAASLPYIGGLSGILFLKPLLGIDGLAWGLIVGSGIQLVLLGLFVDRSWLQRPVFERQLSVRVWMTSVPIFLSVSISTLYLIIDRSFATPFPTGYVANFNFASNLLTLPSQLIVFNITSALLPALVALKTHKGEFSALLGRALAWTAFLLIPVTIVMLTWSRPLVRLLFHSKSFGLEAVNLTSNILVAYSVGIIGLAFKDVLSTALISLGRERLPMLVGLGSLLFSMLLKIVLIPGFGYLAIAFSTGVASMLNATMLLLALFQFMPLNLRRLFQLSGWKVLIAGLFMIAFWLFFRNLVPIDEGLTSWLYVLTVIGIYVLVCAVFKSPELGLLWERIRLRGT